MKSITLKQFIEKCNELSNKGYEVWIEGRGDSTFKLVIEGLEIQNNLNNTGGKQNGNTSRT